MPKRRQSSLLKDPPKNSKLWWIRKRQVYGGSLNYRKCSRPFDKNKQVHVVLKAREWAAFHLRASTVEERIHQVALRCHVRVRDLALNRDHIHLLVSAMRREFFLNFLKQVSAGIGHVIKRELARLGIKKTDVLWVARPFSRLVSWGKQAQRIVKNYIHRNRQEVMGFVSYQPRSHDLSKFLVRWAKPFSTA